MKNQLFLTLMAMIFSVQLFAQNTLPGMRYQAVARDIGGSLIANEEMIAKIEMITMDNSEQIVYTEFHRIRSNQFGLLNLTIGEGEEVSGSFTAIPWDSQNIWARISIKRSTDEDYQIVTSSKLQSVPYAYYAVEAGKLQNEDISLRENDSYRSPSGGNVWSLQGNKDADRHNDPPRMGTVDNNPISFITNDLERMRITEEGEVQITGDLNVGEDAIVGMDLTVKQDVSLNTNGGSTTINGPTTIGGDDMNTATFTGDVQMNKDLNVDGVSTLNGATTIGGDDMNTATFTGDVQMNKDLNVDGVSTLNGATTIGGDDMNAATFTGDVQMNKDLNVTGTAQVEDSLTVKGHTTFDINVTGLQTDQTSYPVLIKGSDQGLAIDLTPATDQCLTSHRGNNYISFWRDGEQKGRIEGMGRADLDPTGLLSLLVNMISNPSSGTGGNGLGTPFGISFNNPFSSFSTELGSIFSLTTGSFPTLTGGELPSLSGGCFVGDGCPQFPTLNKGSFPTLTGGSFPNLAFGTPTFTNPFNSTNLTSTFGGLFENFNPNNTGGDPACIVEQISPAQTAWSLIKSSLMSANMYPNQADATNFESQIFSNYTLDILQGGISTLSSAVTFLTSLASILDPEDIFSEAVDLSANIVSLIIYGAYSDINIGVAYESGAGDYAEWLLRADVHELIQPGDVVGVIGGKISKKFNHADKFMVISTSPLLLGNMPETALEEQHSEKVAFMGQVPVKVMGNVNIGDYILPSGSGDGIAIAVSPQDMLARDYQRIIGVAWESSTDDGFMHLINTAVGINHNDMSKVIEQMQFTLNHIQSALKKMDPTFVAHEYDVTIDAFNGSSIDYNVSATHPTKIAGYFENKSYNSDTELLADVEDRMVNTAGVDLSQVPIIKYAFENPEQAKKLSMEFQDILEDMISVRDQILKENTK